MKTVNEAPSKNGHANLQNGHNDQRSGAAGLFLQPRGLRKIRCPHCAVINLEKFVTYPHCAGCGALLNRDTTPRRPWVAWRRPLGPILWATVLCCAAAAAVGGALMLRRPAIAGQMVIYGQTTRNVQINGQMHLSLSLDSIGGSARESSLLKEVSVRFDKNFLKNFALIRITPPANSETILGSGRYYLFAQLPRETPITFDFKALRPGRHRLRAGISADSQLPTDYVAFINVTPKKPETPKN